MWLRLHAPAAAATLGCAILAIACNYHPYRCEDYSECEGNACPGECVPLPPIDFSGPSLLWVGNAVDAPGCPARASRKVYEGHADLDSSNQCPPCACTQPACVLPSGLTASTSVCPNDGPLATLTPFDAPAGWDGSCTSPTAIPPNELGSVTIDPVTISACKPVQQVPRDFSGSWGQFAFACTGEAIPGACGDPALACVPTSEPPPPGFQQCLVYTREGEPTCPPEYPEKRVLYGGLEDTRSCTACECTEAAPSTCVTSMSVYQDDDCTTPLFENYPVGTGNTQCLDTMPLPLRSMKASWITNEPGACAASGGVPTGEAKPLERRTFCCLAPHG
jgi:hypothetical protein